MGCAQPVSDQIAGPAAQPGGGTDCDVAIIGGGFSAVCLAIHLIKNIQDTLSVVIVNRDPTMARGVAYRTECDAHILNVPAGRMSILSDEPGHFLSWLSPKYSFGADDFVPRRIYGEYIEAALDEALIANAQASVQWIHGNAVSLTPGPSDATVLLESGKLIRARMVVLAVGNSPPQSPPCFESLSARRYKSNAWAGDQSTPLEPAHDVLIVGSGLTAIDQILALSRENHAGTIFLLSRRGRLPALHHGSAAWSAEWTKELPSDIRSIVRAVRRQVELATAAGADWRPVIDSVRQATPRIWRSLSADEKRRFIRHVRSYWEIARHRIPAQTHHELERLVTSGRMVLLSGRITSAVDRKDYVEVTYTERKSLLPKELIVDRIINCTGPGTVTRVHDALFYDLLDRELARLDPLGFGIETDMDGAVLEANGNSSETIFAIGPVCKPSSWESTAVAEIRSQARGLASLIAARLAVREDALA